MYSLEGNPNWNGGTSFEKYPKEFYLIKTYIRERDNYICQICGDCGNSVHHIDYIKNNNNKNNLITLCRSCHTMTNQNRKYCEWWFLDSSDLSYFNKVESIKEII